jgi:hypothetical protein
MAKFSEATLANIQLKAERVWANNQNAASYTTEVEGLRAIRENQTATIEPVTDSKKNYVVRINWIDASMIEARQLNEDNAGNNCDLDGVELDAKSKPLALDSFYGTDFKVNEDQLSDKIYGTDEVVATGIMAALRALDEKVAAVCMAKADSYAGKNLFLGKFTEVAGQTQVPTASYTPAFFAYLQQAAILNKMRSSYIIDNGSLFQQQVIALSSAGVGENKSAAALLGSLKVYTDMFNMAAAGLTTDNLMIRRGALAFASKAKYNEQPIEYGGEVNQTRYSVASPGLPGVRYDVYYTIKCTVVPGEEDEIVHIWRFVSRFGLFLNPEGVETGNTGVLAFNITA